MYISGCGAVDSALGLGPRGRRFESFHPDQEKIRPYGRIFSWSRINVVFVILIKMKITTLNLQGFVDWQRREPAIITYLQQTQPDIILFQEVVYLPETSAHNQVQLINKTLRYPYEHTSVTRLQVGLEVETYREGLGMLSKYPVTKTDTIVLKKAPDDEHNRIAQLLDIRHKDITIQLANVHFSLTDTKDFATAHLAETLNILTWRGEERIIVGDFNMADLSTSKHLWQDSYTSSSQFEYVSFPSEEKRIDYFLVPKSFNLRHVGVSNDELSDHRALTAEVLIRYSSNTQILSATPATHYQEEQS